MVWLRVIPVTGTDIFTATAQVAVLLEPSAALAVMVALPLDTAVTNPVLLTVATAVLLLLHITLLSVAFSGVTVAVSCKVWPRLVNDAVVLLRVIPVTGTDIFTVTAQVAVLLEPSAVVAVIVVLPLDTAVTRPFASTVATDGLLLLHITLLSVELSGVTVAVSCKVWPRLVNDAVVLLRVIPVTGILAAGTVILNVTSDIACLVSSVSNIMKFLMLA